MWGFGTERGNYSRIERQNSASNFEIMLFLLICKDPTSFLFLSKITQSVYCYLHLPPPHLFLIISSPTILFLFFISFFILAFETSTNVTTR